MSDLDELRTRVEAVETEVSRLREDAAVTRMVASLADRDVSEFRGALPAHVQTLNALRVTQLEQGELLAVQGRAVLRIADSLGALVVQVSDVAGQVSDVTELVRRLVPGTDLPEG